MEERVLYDAQQTRIAIDAFIEGLVARYREHVDRSPDQPLRIVGIRRRGDTLARRLEARLTADGHEVPALGVLDITLYRDDFSPGRPQPTVSPSEIPFEVEGAHILLVDDVFQTGRTIRAALNQLADFGRPRRVELAVFIDRQMRELPICPDIVGLEIDRPHDERVQLRLEEDDGVENVTGVTRSESP